MGRLGLGLVSGADAIAAVGATPLGGVGSSSTGTSRGCGGSSPAKVSGAGAERHVMSTTKVPGFGDERKREMGIGT